MLLFFFLNHTPTTKIYTLSLHDALPISPRVSCAIRQRSTSRWRACSRTRSRASSPSVSSSNGWAHASWGARSEEHTSELQSPYDLVCRLLLEKKKKKYSREHQCTSTCTN